MTGRMGDLPTAWAHLQDRLGDALSGLLEAGHRAKSDADEYTDTISNGSHTPPEVSTSNREDKFTSLPHLQAGGGINTLFFV